MNSTFDVFSSRDLRNRAGTLLKDAEEGRLSILTKHGRPMAIALPFNNQLLEQGVHHHLAIMLFEQGVVTLVQAAKIAALTIDEFLDVLQVSAVNVVTHSPEEIAGDLEAIQ